MTTVGRPWVLAVTAGIVALGLGVVVGIALQDLLGAAPFAAPAPPGARLVGGVFDITVALTWACRLLLLLTVAWVLIGMLAARTRLVGRPGAAAARAAWLSATRPWRARESTLGMLELDRWMLIGVPAGLLIATRLIEASFGWWPYAFIDLGMWVVFATVLRVGIGRRSPWPVIAAIGGVVVLRCLITLTALSVAGPTGHWLAAGSPPALRILTIAVAFALTMWMFVAAGWALGTQVGPRRATAFVLAAVGAALLVPAVVAIVIALSTAL